MTPAPLAVLLGGAIDFAGTFPPAQLALELAAAQYARYRAGEYAWALGSFVVPSSRLDDLEAAAGAWNIDAGGAWPLTVVVSGNPASAVARVASFATRRRGRLHVEAIEFPPIPPSEIEAHAERARFASQIFFECPTDTALEWRLDAVARSGGCAKIRTGGVIPQAFPDSRDIIRFGRGCASRHLPWKATAGLHHALTGRYPLTYGSGSATAEMYGFLNVGVWSAMLDRLTDEHGSALLHESAPEAFAFGDAAITWREHTVSQQEVGEVRRSCFRSFGSCSFQEPIDELQRMRLL